MTMFVIKLQQHSETVWLESTQPERWGGALDQAIRFTTRNEARRAAIAAGVSGDWSIDVYLEPSSRLR
jgi:hypothetical protein